MTKRWKLKTNSSNILLVLITLILVKAEWVGGEVSDIPLDLSNSIESDDGNVGGQTNAYVGNDNIAEYFFSSSANNNSFILQGINRCLDNFQLITCVKMLLLSRVNDALSLMEEPNVSREDVRFFNGLFLFKRKKQTTDSVPGDVSDELNLDEEIAAKVKRIFRGRSLLVNLLPNVKIEIEPAPGKRSDFLCFSYRIRKESEPARNNEHEEGRKSKGGMKKKKNKKGGGMPMMMIVPPLIMMGLMPFTLASLKAMVMNAVMINMMALNGAIFMTIRNLVFGPRKGDNVKYVNYGYSKNRQTQSKKPVLIIHSPAAFVEQPTVHKNPVHGHFAPHHVEENNHHGHGGASNFYEGSHQAAGHSEDYEYEYYIVEEPMAGNHHRKQEQAIRRRNQQR